MNVIAVDIETSGLSWQTDTIHGIAVAYEEDSCEYLTNVHYYNQLHQYLSDPDIIKVFHNAGFDMKFLKKAGIQVNGPIHDTMLLAQLVDENQSLKLKDLAAKYLGDDAIKHAKAIWKWLADNNLKKEDLTKAPPQMLSDYASEDANNTYKLYYLLSQKLDQISDKLANVLKVKKTPIDYLNEEVIPVEPVLWNIEMRGVLIDEARIEQEKSAIDAEQLGYLAKLNDLTEAEREEMAEAAYQVELAKKVTPKGKANVKKEPFSWSSTQQVGDLLFTKLGLKHHIEEKTDTGRWKVSDEIIYKALKINGLPPKLKEFLENYKLYTKTLKKLSTYIGSREKDKGILSFISADGRIHSSYKQAGGGSDFLEARGTDTGRLSSANPNLQNLAPFARKFFVPDSGHLFLHFDYSQIELRLSAHFSEDPIFVDTYNLGGDIHRETASAIYGVDIQDVSPEQRQAGKTVNFLLIYNGSANRLQAQLNSPPPKGPGMDVTYNQACGFRDAFFERYAGYKAYLEQQRLFMSKYKMVKSPFGRIRRLPELKYQEGLNYKSKSYTGPYQKELAVMLREKQESSKVPLKNYYGEPLTVYDLARKQVAHALNQGFNFPAQSAAASIAKRAMIKLSNLGYTLVNQIHDSVDILVTRDSLDNDIKVCKNVLETIVKLRVPLVAEYKVLGSFDEKEIIC